uniref:Ion_trans domain-containing protein n=1 Tax=Mesocestoides corti TaxID=53468 RepID=A0A5K3EJE3_MESCO
MQLLQKDEGLKPTDSIRWPHGTLRRRLWLFIEYPLSSRCAKWFSLFSVAMIVVSVISFCLETLPMFITYQVDMNHSVPKIVTCMLWFTIEIGLRFFSCPNRYLFFKSAGNIFDIVSVLPFYIALIMLYFEVSITSSTMYLRILRFLRLLRVIRVLKLSRHSTGLQVLAKTIVTSGRELILLLFFLVVCVVIFSAMVYYAELDSNLNSFTSIPESFWWAVVTMTTVGYGDMHPQTSLGKFVGCVCAIAGVLAIALPVPVIVSNFNYFYVKEKENELLIKMIVLKEQNDRMREGNKSPKSKALKLMHRLNYSTPEVEEKLQDNSEVIN